MHPASPLGRRREVFVYAGDGETAQSPATAILTPTTTTTHRGPTTKRYTVLCSLCIPTTPWHVVCHNHHLTSTMVPNSENAVRSFQLTSLTTCLMSIPQPVRASGLRPPSRIPATTGLLEMSASDNNARAIPPPANLLKHKGSACMFACRTPEDSH